MRRHVLLTLASNKSLCQEARWRRRENADASIRDAVCVIYERQRGAAHKARYANVYIMERRLFISSLLEGVPGLVLQGH